MVIYEVGSDNVSILQVSLLRYKEVKQFAQDYPPNKRQSEDELRSIVLRALVLKY